MTPLARIANNTGIHLDSLVQHRGLTSLTKLHIEQLQQLPKLRALSLLKVRMQQKFGNHLLVTPKPHNKAPRAIHSSNVIFVEHFCDYCRCQANFPPVSGHHHILVAFSGHIFYTCIGILVQKISLESNCGNAHWPCLVIFHCRLKSQCDRGEQL